MAHGNHPSYHPSQPFPEYKKERMIRSTREALPNQHADALKQCVLEIEYHDTTGDKRADTYYASAVCLGQGVIAWFATLHKNTPDNPTLYFRPLPGENNGVREPIQNATLDDLRKNVPEVTVGESYYANTKN